MHKKLLSFVLTLALVFSLMPGMVLASEAVDVGDGDEAQLNGGGSSSSSSSSQATQASNTSSGEIAIKTADATQSLGGSGGGEAQTAVEWKLTSSSANSSGQQQVILSSNQISDLIKAVNQNNANQININMRSSSEENNSSNNDNSNN